jgi:hypothetical protein
MGYREEEARFEKNSVQFKKKPFGDVMKEAMEPPNRKHLVSGDSVCAANDGAIEKGNAFPLDAQGANILRRFKKRDLTGILIPVNRRKGLNQTSGNTWQATVCGAIAI